MVDGKRREKCKEKRVFLIKIRGNEAIATEKREHVTKAEKT